MIRNLGLKKIANYKLNPNLINFDNIVDKKFNHNYQNYRYEHTHSRTIFPNQDSDTDSNKYNDKKLLKLNLHEQLCSNKILSNNEFDKKVRSIVQEELQKINHNIYIDKDKYTDTNTNNLDKTYFISNDNDLEKKIKNIVVLEIDKIKESISDTNTPIQPIQQTITQPVQPVQQTITQPDQKLDSLTIFIICSILFGLSFILISLLGFPGLIFWCVWMFFLLL
jgi:hypothetical protein